MTATTQDIERSFKKWGNCRRIDENIRLKTTQILMTMKRGYYIPDNELAYLSVSATAQEYSKVQLQYFKLPNIENKVAMMKVREELLREFSTQTFEQFTERRTYFESEIERLKKTMGYKTTRQAMSSSYYEKNQVNPTFRVTFLDIVDKSPSALTSNATLEIYVAKDAKTIQKLVLITSQELPSAFMMQLINYRDEIDIKVLLDTQMRFDPTEHQLQPSHRVMENFEYKSFIQNVGYSSENLPKITPRDPMVQFLGLHAPKAIEFNRDNYLNPIGTTYYVRTL